MERSLYKQLKRQQFKKIASCDEKFRYETKKQAVAAANYSTYRTGEVIQAYRCEFCNGFHIGHKYT